jgi:protein-S-isoprenylcysteine O-methyltransferase Ste14
MGGNRPPPAAAPKPLIPRWYLFAGDVLLVALALITVCKSHHPLSWPREVFCAALVLLAALLALLGIFAREGGTSVLPEKKTRF